MAEGVLVNAMLAVTWSEVVKRCVEECACC